MHTHIHDITLPSSDTSGKDPSDGDLVEVDDFGIFEDSHAAAEPFGATSPTAPSLGTLCTPLTEAWQ